MLPVSLLLLNWKHLTSFFFCEQVQRALNVYAKHIELILSGFTGGEIWQKRPKYNHSCKMDGEQSNPDPNIVEVQTLYPYATIDRCFCDSNGTTTKQSNVFHPYFPRRWIIRRAFCIKLQICMRSNWCQIFVWLLDQIDIQPIALYYVQAAKYFK